MVTITVTAMVTATATAVGYYSCWPRELLATAMGYYCYRPRPWDIRAIGNVIDRYSYQMVILPRLFLKIIIAKYISYVDIINLLTMKVTYYVRFYILTNMYILTNIRDPPGLEACHHLQITIRPRLRLQQLPSLPQKRENTRALSFNPMDVNSPSLKAMEALKASLPSYIPHGCLCPNLSTIHRQLRPWRLTSLHRQPRTIRALYSTPMAINSPGLKARRGREAFQGSGGLLLQNCRSGRIIPSAHLLGIPRLLVGLSRACPPTYSAVAPLLTGEGPGSVARHFLSHVVYFSWRLAISTRRWVLAGHFLAWTWLRRAARGENLRGTY